MRAGRVPDHSNRHHSGAGMTTPLARRIAHTLILTLAMCGASAAHAQQAIRIGELNSYKTQPAFLGPYRMGMEQAVAKVIAAGGPNGPKLALISRDDNTIQGDAARTAEELVTREEVDQLTGTFLSNVGLAGAEFARHRKVFFLASEPLTDKIVR